jgi:hypothetical protein
MQLDKFVEEANRLLRAQGFFIGHRPADPDTGRAQYSHSTGLSFAGTVKLPEVIMSGLDYETMEGLLLDLIAAMKEGDLNLDGPSLYSRLIKGYDVAIVPVAHETSAVKIRVPADAETYLVVLPDSSGLFPWDAGCDPEFAEQIDGFDCRGFPTKGISPGGHTH